MNVLTTTWRQLVRRRLWPVAVLLVAALAAVPMLLSRSASPVPPPESSTSAPAETASKDDALATPVVAKASTADRSRRRRVLGARKDPFTPDAIKHPKKAKKAKKAGVKKTQPKQETSTPASSPSAPAPSAPVTTPVVIPPAPPKPSYPKGSVIVRFGKADDSALTRVNVKKLGPLPDDENPLLVYMGLTDHGKKAVFMVDASLDPTGDGDCQPHPSNCETIALAKGETEFFDVADEETGAIAAQYELDLVDIK